MRIQDGKIKKTVIITGYQCNNRCRFCIDADKRELREKSTQEIATEIADARKRGSSYLEFIGGELTIRPDILYLIDLAKRIGFETVVMATNGRMLSYKEFAKKIAYAGLDQIIFSIHGHNASLHDNLTRAKGSFKELMEGINNLRGFKFNNIGSNTTIVKQNYRFVPEIGRLIYGLGIRNAEFIFVDPSYGGAYCDFDSIVPMISKAAPFIRECLDFGRGKKIKHWHIRYVPLCYFLGYENQVSELQEVKLFHTEHLAPDFKNLDVEGSRAEIGRNKTARCTGCLVYKKCEGAWKEYLRRYGDSELNPVLSLRKPKRKNHGQ